MTVEASSLINQDLTTDAGPTFASVKLSDSNASHQLTVDWNEDDTAARALNFKVNSGDRTIDLSGNLTVESASTINQDVSSDATVSFSTVTASGGTATIGTTAQLGTLEIYDGSDHKYSITTAALADNRSWTLPATHGTNQYLKNDGSGGLSWDTPASLANAADITNGIQVTGSGTGIIEINDGTYETILHTSQGEGLAGADFRIGLPESLRSMHICDAGDITDDFGASAEDDPTVFFWPHEGTGSNYGQIYHDNSNFNIKCYGTDMKVESKNRDFLLVHARYFKIEQSADINSGNVITMWSQVDDEMTDTDGRQAFVYIEPKCNQSGTAAFDALYVNPTLTANGTGATGDGNNLINLAADGTCKFRVDTTGGIFPVGMKSGADQSAAGAASGELYIDTDTNAVMIGV